MINIQKNQNEPHLLSQHKSTPNPTYDNGPSGMIPEILESLIAEQCSLCCYCQQRITIDSASVEHKLSRSKHPDKALDYGNMAGVCSCTEGLKKKRQYCDDFKQDKDFTFDLSNIEELIQYEPKTGVIKSENPELNRQLNEVLNLNQEYLRTERTAIYNAMEQFVKSNAKKADFKGIINKNIKKWESAIDGKKIAFCGVMLYFLRKRYNRMK